MRSVGSGLRKIHVWNSAKDFCFKANLFLLGKYPFFAVLDQLLQTRVRCLWSMRYYSNKMRWGILLPFPLYEFLNCYPVWGIVKHISAMGLLDFNAFRFLLCYLRFIIFCFLLMFSKQELSMCIRSILQRNPVYFNQMLCLHPAKAQGQVIREWLVYWFSTVIVLW